MRGRVTEAEVVKKYRPFVVKTAKLFDGHGVSQEDLIQEGLLAVVVAHRAWKPNEGSNMMTWIYYPVRNAMSHAVRRQKQLGMSMRGGRGRKKEVVDLLYLDADIELPLGGTTTAHEFVSSENALNGNESTERDVFALAMLPDAVAQLEPREREVIRLRYVDELTLEEAGLKIGRTRQRVEQIEKDALYKLRQIMKGHDDVC